MTASVEARVIDPEIIKLDHPTRFPVGARVRVTIEPELDEESSAWQRLSTDGLERAYSAEEPDYPVRLIREANPDYKP